MGWNYVIGGYCAAGALLATYIVHMRHRARVLARALPPKAPRVSSASPVPPAAPAPAAPTGPRS